MEKINKYLYPTTDEQDKLKIVYVGRDQRKVILNMTKQMIEYGKGTMYVDIARSEEKENERREYMEMLAEFLSVAGGRIELEDIRRMSFEKKKNIRSDTTIFEVILFKESIASTCIDKILNKNQFFVYL